MSQPETKLYIEPFLGYRAWEGRVDDGMGKLFSWIKEPFWPLDAPIEAYCAYGPEWHLGNPSREPAPAPGCECGIHAWNTPKTLIHYARRLSRYGLVCGEVYLWGTVIVHEHGWRAQFARPTAIYVPPDPKPNVVPRLEAIARDYRVPLVAWPDFAEERKSEP